MKVQSLTDLQSIQQQIKEKKAELSRKIQVIVYGGTCGYASGAKEVLDALNHQITENDIQNVSILEHSCMGCCYIEPYVSVSEPNGNFTLYGNLSAEKTEEIVTEHLINGKKVDAYEIDLQIPFFTHQEKRITRLLGKIDPFKIDDYIYYDGYQALATALQMTQEEVIKEVTASGLRGRGGAGFPTGVKWNFAYQAAGDQKYMVCNADEGDPGAYMNRAELEGNPHAVLEGMAIAAYAIGADKGYIYVRAEYPLAVKTLEKAIEQAKSYGLLGENIFGSGFDFDIELFLGSGAFVCGEETALLASLEQKRGNPRPKPPFPAHKGLFGKPTVLNNVGTLCNVPLVIQNGADWWSSIGSESTKGTKVFSLTGKIKRTGLIEVPMGISLREIVYDIGGGILDNKAYKAVQLGGPSGGCVPSEYLDIPIDYESLKDINCIMGSGAMVVLDEDACMVDTARFFLEFDKDESCGQCTPCRRGLPIMIEILNRICAGKGRMEDLSILQELATTMQKTSLCALGQTAASPTLSTLQHFRDEYIAHIQDKKCPAGVCPALISYYIDPEKCKACMQCLKNCPVQAISGGKNLIHVIDQGKCIRCGACANVCPFNAIEKIPGLDVPEPPPYEKRVIERKKKQTDDLTEKMQGGH